MLEFKTNINYSIYEGVVPPPLTFSAKVFLFIPDNFLKNTQIPKTLGTG